MPWEFQCNIAVQVLHNEDLIYQRVQRERERWKPSIRINGTWRMLCPCPTRAFIRLLWCCIRIQFLVSTIFQHHAHRMTSVSPLSREPNRNTYTHLQVFSQCDSPVNGEISNTNGEHWIPSNNLVNCFSINDLSIVPGKHVIFLNLYIISNNPYHLRLSRYKGILELV